MDLTEEHFVNFYRNAVDALPENGSVKYTKALRKIFNYCMVENKCPRPYDLEISLTNLYIFNYMKMWETKHGCEFDAEKIFKIRLPWWLSQSAYEPNKND
ncbi:MAG: hypothetical protein [Wendovervirus sonii]|uniref:Uncharacterized protein n=1 Tax=phage Lak_Megaphage_Sonny TaxID=3109229 RepID=A0ABZ0Z2B0_9CAUD|nr:MAG: hypothetical protein [phage Lak_Megaphage_Sonny]